ncbi:MAG: hypothetical protein NTX71_06335 [Candidatus Aureabacteria bacterium]|jgi:hypothetical protein|nr:hypothetical protein [Candidatus Auribacterota bacterium]
MRWISVAMIMLLLCALPSCVNVTTERRAESVSRTPEGGYERDSEVKVNTYGWNFLAASLHILFFPFKLLWHAVKIVL